MFEDDQASLSLLMFKVSKSSLIAKKTYSRWNMNCYFYVHSERQHSSPADSMHDGRLWVQGCLFYPQGIEYKGKI